MVRMVTPYIRFLHPDIVGAVVEDNERNRTTWRKKLISRSIDPDFLPLGKIQLRLSRHPPLHRLEVKSHLKTSKQD